MVGLGKSEWEGEVGRGGMVEGAGGLWDEEVRAATIDFKVSAFRDNVPTIFSKCWFLTSYWFPTIPKWQRSPFTLLTLKYGCV